MNTRFKLFALISLGLLLACGTESGGNIAGAPALSRWSSFSAWSEPVSLGAPINTALNDQQATLSRDGLTMFFASNRTGTLGGLDVWVTHRTDLAGPWSEPINLGEPVNTTGGDFAPALSRDGHWLFVGTGRAVSFGSTDIWGFYRENVHDDFGWDAGVNLGPGINNTGFQGGAAYLENEELGAAQLFYNHNIEPVNTGGDIYVSTQAADGSWGLGVPVNELNSPASQQRPTVGQSGLDVYFFSNRPGSIPDATGAVTTDIWVSTRASALDPWSTPTNPGPPINSNLPELHPLIFSHGSVEELYFARTVPGSGSELFVSRRTRRGGP